MKGNLWKMLPKSIWGMYQNILQKRPYMVQTIQTSILMSFGDLVSQTVVEKKDLQDVDFYRMIKFGSIGLGLGPALTKWYRLIDKIGNSSKMATFKKMALDQLIFAPSAIAAMTTIVAISDGSAMNEVKKKLQRDYLQILLTNYKVWPFVQLINFSFVPLNYRVLVTQLVAVAWNTYLSWKLNSER